MIAIAVPAAVYRADYSQLVGLARLLLDDRGQAEEVVQEAFVRTYTGWKRVRRKDDPLPYLRSTIVNLARGGLRHRRVVRERRLDVVPDGESAEVSFETRRDLSHAERRGSWAARTAARVVVLRYFLECSTAECADRARHLRRVGQDAPASCLGRALPASGGTAMTRL